MPSFEMENLYPDERVCGLDEAGMGPWAGPLVVAGCVFSSREPALDFLDKIDDSKRLSPKKRGELMALIADCDAIEHGVAVIEADVIDEIGLAEAWRRGVLEVALDLSPAICLIDGTRSVEIPGTSRCLPIVKGDQKSYTIAVASIIAKVTRDGIMRDIHRENPEYGFDQHVGYGTALHKSMLMRHGPSKHHRKSFAPVRSVMRP
jgi:ribonuclease HII